MRYILETTVRLVIILFILYSTYSQINTIDPTILTEHYIVYRWGVPILFLWWAILPMYDLVKRTITSEKKVQLNVPVKRTKEE